MVFILDQKSRYPIYEQLYQSVTRMAALGALEPEEQLPSVRALAQDLGVNPNTVQKAYQMLEHDGVIVSIPGKGSFLSKEGNAGSLWRTQILHKLHDDISEAADSGVEKSELHTLVDVCYEERGQKHD
ncbi:GntR family transcriptional regulator [Yeguia hominis]|uniref:GntR family transcriptional regulator n=1 Tax=Yeguia hominis TaxID=2763662 RepID=A0A926HSD4_9FIRM|nr:GntR family transcriptional regulator [Yeguia hominis]MBC8534168.1 GntR family transcriptional regulator [Yeguia hominis]